MNQSRRRSKVRQRVTRVCDSDVSHGRSLRTGVWDKPACAEFQKYLRAPCCVTPGTPPRMSREWLGHVEDRQQGGMCRVAQQISAVLADNPVVLAANHIICCHLVPQMCKSASTVVLAPRSKAAEGRRACPGLGCEAGVHGGGVKCSSTLLSS